MIIAEIVIIFFIVDFITGFVHWLEDSYANPEIWWMRVVAEDNILHHKKPRAFLQKSWWQSSYDLVFLSCLYLLVNYLWFSVSWHDIVFVILVVNANQVHKWSHQRDDEKSYFVRKLQQWKILQSVRNHGKHHRACMNSHYCTFGNFLNPVLEYLGFWRKLEFAVSALFNVQPRRI